MPRGAVRVKRAGFVDNVQLPVNGMGDLIEEIHLWFKLLLGFAFDPLKLGDEIPHLFTDPGKLIINGFAIIFETVYVY
jgi:hypothetical protein